MKWIAVTAGLVGLTFGAVSAQSLPSALPAPPLPAPLDTALAEAEATPALRFSYTMRFEWPGAPAITERFDAPTRSWTVVEGRRADLPRQARDKLNKIKNGESIPGGLLYADFRPHLRAVVPAAHTDTQYVFAFIPPEAADEPSAQQAEETVRARLYIDKAQGHLARYEVRGLRPFKPLPVTQMEEFLVIQDFERLGDTGPAVLVRLRSRQKGERFFRKVDTDFTAYFSDFVQVEK